MKKWTDLGIPTPKKTIIPYTPITWDEETAYSLYQYVQIEEKIEFQQVILNRCSSYTFSEIQLKDIANILYLTNIVKSLSNSEYGFLLSKRPIPSAGAIHPIHIFLISNLHKNLLRFDPFSFTLNAIQSEIDVNTIRKEVSTIVDVQDGTIVLLGAEYGKTAAKYNNPDSLIWRDSGILLCGLHMAATYLNMSFCPLGITGEPWVSKLSEQSNLFGVGVAIFGRNPVPR